METKFATVNYNAVGTWLEPYIGTSFKIIKKGVTKLWFEIDYGANIKNKKQI